MIAAGLTLDVVRVRAQGRLVLLLSPSTPTEHLAVTLVACAKDTLARRDPSPLWALLDCTTMKDAQSYNVSSDLLPLSLVKLHLR